MQSKGACLNSKDLTYKCWAWWSHCLCSADLEQLAQFLVLIRAHPKTVGGENLLLHSEITSLWSPVSTTMVLKVWACLWLSVPPVCLHVGKVGLASPYEALDKAYSIPSSPRAIAWIVPEMDCQFALCASKPQLIYDHHLETVTCVL